VCASEPIISETREEKGMEGKYSPNNTHTKKSRQKRKKEEEIETEEIQKKMNIIYIYIYIREIERKKDR